MSFLRILIQTCFCEIFRISVLLIGSHGMLDEDFFHAFPGRIGFSLQMVLNTNLESVVEDREDEQTGCFAFEVVAKGVFVMRLKAEDEIVGLGLDRELLRMTCSSLKVAWTVEIKFDLV